MDVYEIRRANARRLMGGDGISGMVRVTGKDQTLLSRMIGKNPTKNIGPKVARQIEESYKKPKGWLDREHSVPKLVSSNFLGTEKSNGNDSTRVRSDALLVDIPIYDIEVSAGPGVFAPDVEQVNGHLSVDVDWFADASGIKPHHEMLIARAIGDSMAETIKPGDLFVMDYRDKKLNDGVFVIRFDDTVLLKRLSPNPDGTVHIISDNDKYQTRVWHRDDFEILGRVVLRWNGKRF